MDYSTKFLADKCGVSTQAIRNFVNAPEYQEQTKTVKGAMSIPQDVAIAVLRHFGVDESALNGEPESVEPKHLPQMAFPYEKEIELLKAQLAEKNLQIQSLQSQTEQLGEQISKKDEQISLLFDQLTTSQEQLTTALAQAADQAAIAKDLAETNKALSATNAITTAAEKKELFLQEPEKPQEQKQSFWKRLFG